MKPRIRTIKPEAHKDEDLWDAELETGLPLFRAFVGLWGMADREGRFEWRPRVLKSEILPFWDGDFSRVLDALTTRGYVVRYAFGGREFGHVRTFARHQVINNREEPSRLPPPPEPEETQQVDASGTREPSVTDACGTPSSLPFPSSSSSQEGVQGEVPAKTDPPRGKPRDPMARETQWPEDFEPSAENLAHALSAKLDIAEEIGLLAANSKRHGRVSLDWHAELTGWMIRSVKIRREKAEGRQRGSPQRGRIPQENAGKTGFEGVKRL
ncbi:MAG TPA: hypothetical protein VGK73_09015 [Polyangiaceae bacterium]